jgi:hypothetical protein
MLARFAAIAAAAVLGACTSLEPAGRNADRAPPPPAASAEEMAAPTQQPAPGPVAAPGVTAPTPQPQPAQADERDGDVIVPGERERQVPPPGDPRTTAERVEDIRRWDTCVMEVQNAFDRDPMRPQLTSPEEYCSQTLGMGDRLAVPDSRAQRR